MATVQDLLNKKTPAADPATQGPATPNDNTIQTGVMSSSTQVQKLSVGQVATGISTAAAILDLANELLPMFTYLMGRIKAIILANGSRKKADANGLITAETEEEKQILAHLEAQNAGYVTRVDKHTEQA